MPLLGGAVASGFDAAFTHMIGAPDTAFSVSSGAVDEGTADNVAVPEFIALEPPVLVGTDARHGDTSPSAGHNRDIDFSTINVTVRKNVENGPLAPR